MIADPKDQCTIDFLCIAEITCNEKYYKHECSIQFLCIAENNCNDECIYHCAIMSEMTKHIIS